MAGRQVPTVPIKQDFAVNTREAETVPEDTNNPFADPAVAERYAQVYEKAQYECRHVFDPTLTWTAKEESALVWKLDLHVCLWAVCTFLGCESYGLELRSQCVMFFGLQVDRGNLVQAVSDNLLDDLGLSTNGSPSPILLTTPQLTMKTTTRAILSSWFASFVQNCPRSSSRRKSVRIAGFPRRYQCGRLWPCRRLQCQERSHSGLLVRYWVF